MTRAQRRRIHQALARFVKRAQESPKTSGAAIAALYGVLHAIYNKPSLLGDPTFIGLALAALATVYGLFEAQDSGNHDTDK